MIESLSTFEKRPSLLDSANIENRAGEGRGGSAGECTERQKETENERKREGERERDRERDRCAREVRTIPG